MRTRKLRNIGHGALIALGVFMGRGAHADTVLDFNNLPADQAENSIINQGFGSFAAASSDGVTVTGFGTPNIGLTWTATGASDTEWDYYDDGGAVWTAVQLQDSVPGYSHDLTFTPNNPQAGVKIESFNLDGYYISTERFTYNISVLAGTNVVSGPTLVSFVSDGTKNHPVNVNYTGVPGETLELRFDRVASTLAAGEVEGGAYNIAVDDILFAQVPATQFPAGPQVVSISPSPGQAGVAAIYYPYLASISNGDTTVNAGTIQLKIDQTPVSPPPSISSADGLTNVSFLGTNLLSSGSHVFTLTYNDSGGATYTNELVFSADYATLPASYALALDSGESPGFTLQMAVAPQDITNNLDSTVARAVAQLNGTLIDPGTGLPYSNVAIPGPNPDGSYNFDTVINFNSDGLAGEGDFTNDQAFPGLLSGRYNWFSSEALLYLDLAAGYYRLGVNSDDGFEVNALPPKGVSGSPIQLGLYDNGRSAGDTLFDVLVPVSGLYPFQLIYFQSTGNAELEFFSVTNLATDGAILINDTTYTNAIISYRTLALPFNFTGVAQSGPNIVLNWSIGTPPYQVQVKTNLTDKSWSNFGSPTTNTTATIPIQPGTLFFRVFGQ